MRKAIRAAGAAFFIVGGGWKKLAIGLFLMTPTLAYSQGFGELATNIRSDQLGPAANLVGAAVFVIGLVLGGMGIMQMVKRGRNGEGMETGKIVAMMAASAAMVGFPVFLSTAVGTIFGGNADTNGIAVDLQSIN